MSELRVFTFSPAWGLPTSGPFALKLLAWLDHAGIPYRHCHEDRSDKGPLGKSPWIETGDTRMGDSDAIIRFLARRHGLSDPLQARTAAEVRNDMMKTAFEERFHQILEWELFVHPAGFAEMRRMIRALAPPFMGSAVAFHLRRHFSRQLHARGMARHSPEFIADTGQQMLDGLAACLDSGDGWLGEGAPSLADLAVWGQVAPMLAWPMDTPVARHAKEHPVLNDWHGRIMACCFAAGAQRRIA